MIAYAQARRLIAAAAEERGGLPEETVALDAALGRTAAQALRGREPLPPFDNSSMDGYALAAARAASGPATLPVLGTIMAGDAPRCQVKSGAWRIMTGAPIPAGCDAVVPVEWTRERDGGSHVDILRAVEPGQFVRGQGRDFAPGGEICAAGTRLGARHLLALAALGVARVPVRRRPRVALISTGRELVSPADALRPGQTRDASSTYLAAAVAAAGADFSFHGIVTDDAADFEARLRAVMAAGCDLALTTGAVSMGAADFIPATLAKMGAETLFHQVAIRPGKPVLFARFPRGPHVFGLPGNPVSTVVGLRFLVEPLLRGLLGRPEETGMRALLSAPVDKPEGLRCFFKARRATDGGVEVLPGQASFQIHSLLSADCWAILPEEGARLGAGAEVELCPLSEPLS